MSSRMIDAPPNSEVDGKAEIPITKKRGNADAEYSSHVQVLLLDIRDLSKLLSRSVPSLRRDDAAGRLPDAVWIGSSKRWRRADIEAWVEMGCPNRSDFEVRKKHL